MPSLPIGKKSGYRFGTLVRIAPEVKCFRQKYSPICFVPMWPTPRADIMGPFRRRFTSGFRRQRKEMISSTWLNLVLAVARPKLVVADNYTGIKRGGFRKFLNDGHIPFIFIAPNHSSSNGLVERVNQTILERMRCALVQYTDTIHSVKGYTPNFLLTGKDEEGLFTGETLREGFLL